MLGAYTTPGDKMQELLSGGAAVCKVTFYDGRVGVGTVRYLGVIEGKKTWVFVGSDTPDSQHFFGLGEVRDIEPFFGAP